MKCENERNELDCNNWITFCYCFIKGTPVPNVTWRGLAHSVLDQRFSTNKPRLIHQRRTPRSYWSLWHPIEVGNWAISVTITMTGMMSKPGQCWLHVFLFLIGLCGAVHTGVARHIRNDLNARSNPPTSKIFCVGDKSRSVLQRTHGDKFIVSANEVSVPE